MPPSRAEQARGTPYPRAARLQTTLLGPAPDHALLPLELVEAELQTGEGLLERRQAVALDGALASLGRTQLRVDDPT